MMAEADRSVRAATSHGWQGAVLKMLRADDYLLKVVSKEIVSDNYLRLGFSGAGLLVDHRVKPTLWLRLWFTDDNGKPHQRAYTVIDADPAVDEFFIEFALHEGTAARWARNVEIGETISATYLKTKFELPSPEPQGWILVGDTASLPAINSILDELGKNIPAVVWLQSRRESDEKLTVRIRPGDTLRWVSREKGDLLAELRANSFYAQEHFGWVAADNVITRTAVNVLRTQYLINRKSIVSQAYWMIAKDSISRSLDTIASNE